MASMQWQNCSSALLDCAQWQNVLARCLIARSDKMFLCTTWLRAVTKCSCALLDCVQWQNVLVHCLIACRIGGLPSAVWAAPPTCRSSNAGSCILIGTEWPLLSIQCTSLHVACARMAAGIVIFAHCMAGCTHIALQQWRTKRVRLHGPSSLAFTHVIACIYTRHRLHLSDSALQWFFEPDIPCRLKWDLTFSAFPIDMKSTSGGCLGAPVWGGHLGPSRAFRWP